MCFGMTAYLCVHVWDEMEEALPKGAMIFHLLWSLMFLKVYGMEDTMAADRILVFYLQFFFFKMFNQTIQCLSICILDHCNTQTLRLTKMPLYREQRVWY